MYLDVVELDIIYFGGVLMILTWDIIRRTIEVLWLINVGLAIWTVFVVIVTYLLHGHGF